MGRFVPATGLFPATSVSDLLSEVYVKVIGSKWGIYKGKSHLPFGKTKVEDLPLGYSGSHGGHYEITIWPNDQQDITVEEQFNIKMQGTAPWDYGIRIGHWKESTIVAIGIFNYSVPWLDWYVRVGNQFRQPWEEDDIWTELKMESIKGKGSRTPEEWRLLTDKERLQQYEWVAHKTKTSLTYTTPEMINEVERQIDEFEDTNITYMILREMDDIIFTPINWCHNPPQS